MTGRQGGTARALLLSGVSVVLAAAGHSLGHGTGLDPVTLVVAAAVAAALGALLARRWSLPRLLLVLALVQVVVHVLAGYAADPRLVAASAHAHGHAEGAVGTGLSSPSSAMLAWHLVAVPVSAVLLAALARSAVLVASLLRRLLVARPVRLRALPPVQPPWARPTVRPRLLHLVVSRSNAPPCPA